MTIEERNDEFRRSGAEGLTYVTRGISALSGDAQVEIFRRVRGYDDFSPDNDRHGEHDFGSFDHDGQTIFWKIDLYDNDLNFRSPNPKDPAVTTRLLTTCLRRSIDLRPEARLARVGLRGCTSRSSIRYIVAEGVAR
jgi:hypothetical protein